MSSLVSYSLPNTPLPPAAEQKMEIEAARKLPFVYDEDCPLLTDDQLKQFRRECGEAVPSDLMEAVNDSRERRNLHGPFLSAREAVASMLGD